MFADLYVLANERSEILIRAFLDRFLPAREPAASEFAVPQYSDRPEIVFTDAADLIRHCVARPELEHAIYWCNVNRSGDPAAAHVFFLSDGGLVLGLSTRQYEDVDHQDELLQSMKDFAASKFGYIAYEEPPVRSTADFRRLIDSFKK